MVVDTIGWFATHDGCGDNVLVINSLQLQDYYSIRKTERRLDVHKSLLCNNESIGVDMYLLIYFYCAQQCERDYIYINIGMHKSIHEPWPQIPGNIKSSKTMNSFKNTKISCEPKLIKINNYNIY